MDAQKQKEVVSQLTLLASISSFVIFLAALFLGLIKSEEATFTFSGAVWLIKHNPGYWFVILFALLFPSLVAWLSIRFTRESVENHRLMAHESKRMNEIQKFTQQLILDNLAIDFSIEGENDALGKSLVQLRDTLRENKENNLKLRLAEEQRNWIADGLAIISEILRNNLHDLDQLSFKVIKELTKYINAIQGGFYMLDNSDRLNRFFLLKAFFAYDRRKFADQKVKWGDGLIGTCALEQKVIHLRNIPDSYISVTSGLGEANPGNLLIIPMQYENEIYGVLEFASFNPFEKNHIALLEKAAESVASTLSSVRTNLTTARLLEESKAQTQALTSHEEEMRQNMEELQATQEEATRQAHRFLQLEENLNQSIMRSEFNYEGKFVSANNLFYNKFEYSQDITLSGKPVEDFISEDQREHFREIWKKLTKERIPFSGYLKHTTRTGKDLWTLVSLVASGDEEDREEKIVILAMDASDEVGRNQKNLVINELTDKWSIRFELDINGNFQDYNHHFIHLLKYSQKDLKAMVIFDVIDPIELEGFNKHWETIIAGSPFTGLFKLKSAHGEEKWITGSFGALHNKSREINRIVFTGHDVSHEKGLETENKGQSDTLKKQEKMLRDAEKELANKLRETKTEMMIQLKLAEKMKAINEGITEEAPVGIVTTGPDNRIIYFNQAAEALWTINRTEVINHDVNVLFPEKLTEEDELLGSFTRPGDVKITGVGRQSMIIDGKGNEKKVLLKLSKNRIDNENTYTAFLLPMS